MRAAPLAHRPGDLALVAPVSTPLRGGGAAMVLPGLGLAAVVGATAHLAAEAAFPEALTIGFEVPLAMLLGLVLASLGGVSARAAAGVRFAGRHVLALGIVLLGLRLNLHAVAAIGAQAVALVVAAIAGACTIAVVLGRRLGVTGRVAVLIGVGTSVCGNSAILAAAPVVRADDREVGFAVATVTVLGTLAVFGLPLIGHVLGLDVLAFGLWAGTAVPDTAQTIATGAAYESVARDVATVVKLVRNVLMAPLVVLLAWAWTRRGDGGPVPGAVTRRSARRAFPYFLIGFIALAAVRTARLVDPETVADVDAVTRGCFVVALAALGLQTRVGDLRVLGPRPFVLGVATSTLLAGGTLAAILALGLGPTRTAVAGAVDPSAAGVWTVVCDRGCARPAAVPPAPAPAGRADAAPAPVRLDARVVASGIPGAGAVSPVGRFHPGSPVHDKRSFATATRPGRVLDPTRLLVASASNHGAPVARHDWAPGSVLSVATDAPAELRVPARFAAAGGQARALDGDVQLYTAQSPAFLNRLTAPDAVTADMPAVAAPQGISVNNAFGRPWFANAAGVETVTDPDGRPLADPPSERSGGVFALPAAVSANALLGASPDTSGRAVFAVATADGALAQVHVEEGVEDLAPAGTVAPTRDRVGMAFNWVPDRFLYVTDPARDAVVQVRLDDDFEVFRVTGIRRLQGSRLSRPVDLAPAVPEIANPAFASNTTLAGGSDLYVANRGSGEIVRLRQDGRIRAVARLRVPGHGLVGPGLVNGIAVAPDADRLWISLSRGRSAGSVVEVRAFGAPA